MRIFFENKHPDGLAISTIRKRNSQLKAISNLFGFDGSFIDDHIFNDSQLFLHILNSFLNDKQEYTKRSYYYCLMCFTKFNNCNINTHLALRDLYNNSHPISKTIADKDAINKINRLLTADNHNAIILHNIFTHIGAIRLFEIIHTTIVDLPDKNFLDIHNAVWHFKACATKQKKDRSIDLPLQFLQHLKTYDKVYLITKKNGKPYTNTGALSAMIKKYTGINFQTIRRSDVHNSINQGADFDQLQKRALVLGHRLDTQLDKYANIKPAEIKRKPIVIKKKVHDKPRPTVRKRIPIRDERIKCPLRK